MVKYNKLVRDKIPELLDSKGISYEKRIATPEEYRVELIKKLQEEISTDWRRYKGHGTS